MEGYYQTTTGNTWNGWTQITTEPIEVATVDGMKPYEGYTIEVND